MSSYRQWQAHKSPVLILKVILHRSLTKQHSNCVSQNDFKTLQTEYFVSETKDFFTASKKLPPWRALVLRNCFRAV